MENKDLIIKLMCKALYAHMGYCTHYEIKLRTKSYISSYKTHDISDIDVYGYKFNSDLTWFQIGAECKSGEASALDELYKFLGISQSYHLDRAYLIKSKIHQNARQIALQNNFICLTEAELRKLLLGLEVNVDHAIKVEHAKYHRHFKSLSQHKPKNDKLIDYLQLDFWNKENWKNIHNILHILKQLSDSGLFKEGLLPQDKYVYYHAIELLTLCILKNCSQAIILNFADFDSAFINCLYGGAEALNEKRRIQDAVNIATKESERFEPEWQDTLVAVSSRLAQSPFAAAAVPMLFQDICENCFYDDKVVIEPKILHKHPELTRKFAQDVVQFVTKSCGLSEHIFSEFMAL